jgi:hypothetical protein
VKLGKLRPKRSLKALPLSNYIKASSVVYPRVMAWERNIQWGVLANDSIGDCTIAGALHLIMGWQAVANAGTPIQFTDQDAIDLYSAVTGYNPADPSTDQGAAETDVLNYWKATGMKGHKIAGYTSLDVSNIEMIKAAVFLFGGVYLGFQVPRYIMDVAQAGGTSWSQTPGVDTTIEGGHAIYICGYGADGVTIVSWGKTYTFDWDFWTTYVDEAYGIVSTDWIKKSGQAPSGLDLEVLLADLNTAPPPVP